MLSVSRRDCCDLEYLTAFNVKGGRVSLRTIFAEASPGSESQQVRVEGAEKTTGDVSPVEGRGS